MHLLPFIMVALSSNLESWVLWACSLFKRLVITRGVHLNSLTSSWQAEDAIRYWLCNFETTAIKFDRIGTPLIGSWPKEAKIVTMCDIFCPFISLWIWIVKVGLTKLMHPMMNAADANISCCFIYKLLKTVLVWPCICLEEKQAHELMAVRVDQLWGPWVLRILVYLWSTMKSGWDGIITRFGNQLFQLPPACRCQIGEHICVFAQRVMWNGFWYNISIGKNKIRIIPATLNNCF